MDSPAERTFNTPDSRWRALQTRDPLAATSFIYAVTSTGIYCRPTCPARLARRANVRFFDTAAHAARAGFRPCRRCRPADADAPSTWGRHAELVGRACAEMEARGGAVDLRGLARGAGLSPRYFHGVFKGVVGVTPGVYAERVRTAKGVGERGNRGLSGEMVAGLAVDEEMLGLLASCDGLLDEGILWSDDGITPSLPVVGI